MLNTGSACQREFRARGPVRHYSHTPHFRTVRGPGRTPIAGTTAPGNVSAIQS